MQGLELPTQSSFNNCEQFSLTTVNSFLQMKVSSFAKTWQMGCTQPIVFHQTSQREHSSSEHLIDNIICHADFELTSRMENIFNSLQGGM